MIIFVFIFHFSLFSSVTEDGHFSSCWGFILPFVILQPLFPSSATSLLVSCLYLFGCFFTIKSCTSTSHIKLKHTDNMSHPPWWLNYALKIAQKTQYFNKNKIYLLLTPHVHHRGPKALLICPFTDWGWQRHHHFHTKLEALMLQSMEIHAPLLNNCAQK